MTTSELKAYIDRILGNNIRCLLPSYWWKRAFGATADAIDTIETDTQEKIGKVQQQVQQQVGEVRQQLDKLAEKRVLHADNPQDHKEENLAMINILWGEYLVGRGHDPVYLVTEDGAWLSPNFTVQNNHIYFYNVPRENNSGTTRQKLYTYHIYDKAGGEVVIEISDSFEHYVNQSSQNAVQSSAVYTAMQAKADKTYVDEMISNKADKTYVDEKTSNNSYAIVLASKGFNMRRYGKSGRFLGEVYIKPNVPTKVYATAFAPNGGTGRIKSIKLNHLDTQGATDMGFMFGGRDMWQNVEELDLSYIDTSSATVMDNFVQLPKVTKLDVTSFDTSNVVNMSCMFRYCENLTDIDVSNFDTSKVLYFDSMFGECKSLKSLDLSNFNTSSATTMSEMFFYCSDLEYLNLSSFDTSNIESLRGISGMFFGCGSIKTLILGENFFRVAAPIEGDGLQYLNKADFSGLSQWTDESVVTSLVTNSYDRIANGLPEINLSLSSQTMDVLTDEHKAIIAAKGYILQ